MPEPARWLTTTEAAAVLSVGRRVLDRLAREHADIPGGPVVVAGSVRLHVRWPPDGLGEWFAAVRARTARPASAPVQKPRPAPRSRRAGADRQGGSLLAQVLRERRGA